MLFIKQWEGDEVEEILRNLIKRENLLKENLLRENPFEKNLLAEENLKNLKDKGNKLY